MVRRRSFEEIRAVEQINSACSGMTSREFSQQFDRVAGPQWTEVGVCIRVGTQVLRIKNIVWNSKARQIEIVVK